MTDHTTPSIRVPAGTDGYAWWSVAAADGSAAFAAPMATANRTTIGAGKGNASAYVPSVSIAA